MAEAIYLTRIVMARTLLTEIGLMLHAIALTVAVSLTANYFSTDSTLTQIAPSQSSPTFLSVGAALPHR